MEEIEKLLDIMARLRDPETGCPWDRRQDFASIAPYTIEEAYEVADAVGRGDLAGLRDELGDLLLQVVFHARMAEEAGAFAFRDVAAAISEKLVRRHPHVFGSDEQKREGAVAGSWERIKAAERRASGDGSALDGIARALPALLRAEKTGKRASDQGFDWADARGPAAKVREELAEVEAARGDARRTAEEIGDLLLAVVNLARHLGVAPESALREANDKFERRFRYLEKAARARGETLAELTMETLEAWWSEAKGLD